MPGLDQTALRRVNTAAVLRALAASDEDATTQALIGATGLSRRTIELILGELVAAGWATDRPSANTGGAGRPARRFRFAAGHRLVAAARIDTHLAHGAVADLHGRILGQASRELGDYADPRRAVADAAAVIRAAADEAAVPLDRLRAGGVAAGGVIDASGVVRRLVSAPDWSGFELAGAFAGEFGVPWVADNDAKLAALAEHRAGVARGRRHLAWLIHGHRTGVGFIVNGEVHRGKSGAAGELIESRVLGLRRSEEHPIGMLTSPVAADRDHAAALVAAALAGDRAAMTLAEEFAAMLADAVDVIAWTVAPELIVLGGGLETAADLLIPLVRDRAGEVGLLEIELKASSIGADAPLIGAVRYALDRIDSELFGPTVC
jgi:predicted NBD/HSP70 family sugar kinase